MRTKFHYVVKFEDSPAVLREFDAPYLELRLGKLVERMKDADVVIVPNRKYKISMYKGTMDYTYADVSFYSDGKGDVHYGSFRPAITAWQSGATCRII